MQTRFFGMFGLIVLTALLAFSQKSNKLDIRPYYFPYAQFLNPTVYAYERIGNTSGTNNLFYWYMVTVVNNKDTIFYTSSYSENFLLLDTMTERISKKGSELVGFNYFDKHTRLTKTDVFKWKQAIKESIFFAYESGSTEDETVTEKKRTLTNASLEVMYNNKSYPAIEMTDVFTNRYKNGKPSTSFNRTCMYAKGIGLVQFTNKLPEGNQTLVLKKIYSEQEWEKLKRE
ncbi:MAG TPA: hypothetical protein VK177_11365 [Flavobacteriales bacterium]|nr:hypothetical protein [Flavobacteriales bacterium]